MRLTNLLFRRNRMPHGNIFHGKDRLVQIVKPVYVTHARRQFQIEEDNMLYLRYPYLTKEESHGHAKDLGKKLANIQKIKDEARSKFKTDVTLSDRLGHLKVKEAWD